MQNDQKLHLWHGWIGRGVHKAIRQVAKLPCMMMDKEEAVTQEGTYFDQLDGVLGIATYKALCADTADVVLETIYYCQTELDSVRKSLRETRRVLNPNSDHNEEVSPAATVAATYTQRSCMHVLALIIFLYLFRCVALVLYSFEVPNSARQLTYQKQWRVCETFNFSMFLITPKFLLM